MRKSRKRCKSRSSSSCNCTDCVILIDMATVIIIVHPGAQSFVIVRSIDDHCVVAAPTANGRDIRANTTVLVLVHHAVVVVIAEALLLLLHVGRADE